VVAALFITLFMSCKFRHTLDKIVTHQRLFTSLISLYIYLSCRCCRCQLSLSDVVVNRTRSDISCGQQLMCCCRCMVQKWTTTWSITVKMEQRDVFHVLCAQREWYNQLCPRCALALKGHIYNVSNYNRHIRTGPIFNIYVGGHVWGVMASPDMILL
jgi:hypothetical protein